MVTVETRIQKEIHRLIVEETWKHLKTSNNFDMVLSLVTLLDPYTPEPDYCDEDCCNLYIKTKSNMKYCSVCR